MNLQTIVEILTDETMIQKMPPHRSQFDAFCFMRTSHLQRRRFASESVEDFQDDAKISLLRKDDRLESVELGDGVSVPSWTGAVEGLNYQISRVETRVSELNSLHMNQLSRPSMEEGGEEEERIMVMTQELTKQFSECNKQLSALQRHSGALRGGHKTVLVNIVNNLVSRMQEITNNFRLSQGNYLRKVEAREERNSQYFSTFSAEEEDDGLMLVASSSSGFQQQDLIMMEENSKVLRRREQEISSIVQSISDLNTIFKDLAGMVSEQGEVVDRIDYNIEHASIQVESGLEQIKKAAKYQRSNRKMKCILVLGITLILLIFILIVIKT